MHTKHKKYKADASLYYYVHNIFRDLINPLTDLILPSLSSSQDIHNLYKAGIVSRGFIRRRITSLRLTLPLTEDDEWLLETVGEIKSIVMTSLIDYTTMVNLNLEDLNCRKKPTNPEKLKMIEHFETNVPVKVDDVFSYISKYSYISIHELGNLKFFKAYNLIHYGKTRVVFPRSCRTIILKDYNMIYSLPSSALKFCLKAYGLRHYEGPKFTTSEGDKYTGALITKVSLLNGFPSEISNIVRKRIISLAVRDGQIKVERYPNLKYFKIKLSATTINYAYLINENIVMQITKMKGVLIVENQDKQVVYFIDGPNPLINDKVRKW